MTTLRSLMISPILPALGGNGLAMRMGVYAEALSRFSDTHVLVIPVAGTLPPSTPMAAGFRLHMLKAGGGQLDAVFTLLSQISDPIARLKAFSEWGRPSQSAGLNRPVLHAVAELVRDLSPHLIHVGRVSLAPCIAVLPDGPAVTLDLDEDERAAFAMRATRNPREAAWLRLEGLACDQLVASYGPRASRIHVSSVGERIGLAARHPDLPFMTIPNAVPRAIARPAATKPAAPLKAIFVGSLSYVPNAEGLIWFIRRVMPLLKGSDFHLDIIGIGAPPNLIAAARRRDVKLHGWVADLDAAYRRATLAILPLQGGGGTRIKLLEAAARGLPFVATRSAAKGISLPLDSGWIADSPMEFANSIRLLVANPLEARRRAVIAQRYVRVHHDRAIIVEALAKDMHSVLLSKDD